MHEFSEPSKVALVSDAVGFPVAQMGKLRLKVTRLMGATGRNLLWRKPLVPAWERAAGWT